ncbi:hypothetical protein B0H66DRAFT_529678 [Apodospora peruviana]|uniref:COP9 signalosome complex subunit 3 n=1 Tax=Apodospora peruviana TaxID=516989 RepID=A0AAE0MAS3_9PEZI|nr:hypothetical protein B0H66DRAFT_529678 [Apodospora peruviana]
MDHRAAMDHCASVLLAFPPASELADNEQYHKAVRLHIQKVEKLMAENGPAFPAYAENLLGVIHPADHSISYLALLQSLLTRDTPIQGGLLPQITTFLMTFDPRQIRYVGLAFSSLLKTVSGGELFPASVAGDLLATALLRIDPSGSVLTSHHIAAVNLAYETDNVDPVLPLIEKTIVFYPGVKSTESRYPCDMESSPVAYVTPESGLTTKLTSTAVLQYDLLCGMCFMQKRLWRQAFDALERVVTYPTKDVGCSKIMVEAHNKWVLVGLLLNGKTPTLPPITGQSAQKAYSTLGKPYSSIGKAFEKDTAETLKAEFESLGLRFWAEDGNLGLMQLVLSHYQRWQIVNLRDVYTKISLEQIRKRTQSAETGGQLATGDEMKALVQSMIDDGMLNGVIETPADGTPAYLTFIEPTEDLSEADFAAQLLLTARRMKDLGPIVKATNERLAMNRDYLRAVIKDQRREKDGLGRDPVAQFDTSIEDEDLMTGILPGR